MFNHVTYQGIVKSTDCRLGYIDFSKLFLPYFIWLSYAFSKDTYASHKDVLYNHLELYHKTHKHGERIESIHSGKILVCLSSEGLTLQCLLHHFSHSKKGISYIPFLLHSYVMWLTLLWLVKHFNFLDKSC